MHALLHQIETFAAFPTLHDPLDIWSKAAQLLNRPIGVLPTARTDFLELKQS
jgi:hypothetical protein